MGPGPVAGGLPHRLDQSNHPDLGRCMRHTSLHESVSRSDTLMGVILVSAPYDDALALLRNPFVLNKIVMSEFGRVQKNRKASIWHVANRRVCFKTGSSKTGSCAGWIKEIIFF